MPTLIFHTLLFYISLIVNKFHGKIKTNNVINRLSTLSDFPTLPVAPQGSC